MMMTAPSKTAATTRLSNLTAHLSPLPPTARATGGGGCGGIAKGQVILFQGDSITDAGRSRENQPGQPNVVLGQGYAKMVAATLLAARPGDGLEFYNRGVGGNRIVDVYSRMAIDGTVIQPDLVSMLIGVNDTCLNGTRVNGVPVPKYETVFRMFLAEMREANPSVRFVLCHPFVLDAGNVKTTGHAAWREEIDERRLVVTKLATEFGAVEVDFQSMFDEAITKESPEYWMPDGVHPSHAGHMLMTQAWLKAVGEV
jgi:lysophospholipase L1-like esterase